MTVREMLEQCRAAAEKAHLLAALIATVNIPGCAGVRGQQLDGMPRGGNDETRAAVDRLDYYTKMFGEWNARLEAIKPKVEAVLSGLPEEDAVLMRLYYVEALTDAGCSLRMGWKRWQTANEKRREILQKLHERLDRIGVDRYNGSGEIDEKAGGTG